MALSTEHIEKIAMLLRSDDVAFVIQGKELLESLVKPNDMYLTVKQIFELETPKSYTEIFEKLRSQNLSRSAAFDLTVWIIDLANAVEAEWVQNRIRRYQINVYGYEVEYSSTGFSKETYE